jgi:hypothetical protein
MFSPPYASEKVLRAVRLGMIFMLVVVLVAAGTKSVGGFFGGAFMGFVFLYAALYAVLSGETWSWTTVFRYREHPVSYSVIVLTYACAGAFFLASSIYKY